MTDNLVFIQNSNFKVDEMKEGKVLTHNIQGLTFVLFYSNSCPHCKQVIQIFQELPRRIKGMKFGFVNVSQEPGIVVKSNKSIMPIEYVPYLMFYTDGVPYVQYTGEYNMNKIIDFLNNVNKTIKNTKKSENFGTKKKVQLSHPCTLGIPICSLNKKMCYLDFSEAYQDKKE